MSRQADIARIIRERMGTVEDAAANGLSGRVVYPGHVKSDMPIAGAARWAELFITYGREEQITLGNSALYRQVGIVDIPVYVQTRKGDAEVLTLADAVCTAFRSFQATQGSTLLVCGWPSEPHIEGAVRPDGPWLRALVRFDFIADTR